MTRVMRSTVVWEPTRRKAGDSAIGKLRRGAFGAAMIRVLGRLTMAAVGLIVLSLVTVQFARIIGDNVAMAQSLAGVDRDIDDLQAKRLLQLRALRRLTDPEGAIPEIHERLRLTRSNEELIFVKPQPTASP